MRLSSPAMWKGPSMIRISSGPFMTAARKPASSGSAAMCTWPSMIKLLPPSGCEQKPALGGREYGVSDVRANARPLVDEVRVEAEDHIFPNLSCVSWDETRPLYGVEADAVST